jgi:ribonuclease D
MGFLKIKGARDLSRRELAVLRELAMWRDSVARGMDRATFRVVGNEQLLDMSTTQPRSRDDLSRVRGLSRGMLERSQDILDAVQRGLDVPEDELPKFPRSARWDRDPQFDVKVNALKAVRDEFAQKLDMDPGVLGSRERLEAVARRNPKSIEELAEIPELRRWQTEVLGAGFVKALARVPGKP